MLLENAEGAVDLCRLLVAAEVVADVGAGDSLRSASKKAQQIVGGRIAEGVAEDVARRCLRALPTGRSSNLLEPTIEKPPGTLLNAFSRFVYSRRTHSLVFEPTLRDLMDEYTLALAQGQRAKAWWCKWRGYFAFWSSVVNQLPVSFLRLLVRLWKAAGT